MITQIYLRNIKCFPEETVPLSNLNILSGINGSGKSTIIQCILMAVQGNENSLVEINGSLIEIGDYLDLQHENASDDSLEIGFSLNEVKCSWGYHKGYESENIGDSVALPHLKGDYNCLEDIRNNLIYICAERWGPRSNVPLNSYNPNTHWLGKHGEFTIQFLNSLLTGTLRTDDGESLSTTYDSDPRKHDDISGNIIFSHIVAWMGEISPNVDINASVITEAAIGYSAFSFGKSKKFKATNVGFGLSYALSIVTALVAAKKDAIIVIENPEAHLHPRGQSKLGFLMALAANAGIQIIIETHSEHIINGARIAVRKNAIPADLVNIVFVERNDAKMSSYAQQLNLNEMGQVNSWPQGFFDQQSIDMKTLITGE